MANNLTRAWEPDWAVPPGEVLLEALDERGMTQAELARRMGRPVKTINEIIKAKTALTPETAIQLERVLGISARLWSGLETLYRHHLAEVASDAELEAHAEWARRFPLRDLRKYGVIGAGASKDSEFVGDLLRWFGVASVEAWEHRWRAPAAAYRSSRAFASSPEAVAAWLRWGERKAEELFSGVFEESAVRDAFLRIRPLTRREPVYSAVQEATALLAEAGVLVVLTPEIAGTRLSGAARWLTPERALIQLSLRHKRDDQFWHTLYHEGGHIVSQAGRPGRRSDVIDEVEDIESKAVDAEEARADAFARDTLLPPEAYAHFVATGDFSAASVRRFAKEQDIAPGVVVGRLQYDRHLGRQQLNTLKKAVRPASRAQ